MSVTTSKLRYYCKNFKINNVDEGISIEGDVGTSSVLVAITPPCIYDDKRPRTVGK